MPLAVALARQRTRTVPWRLPPSATRLGVGGGFVNYSNEFTRSRQLPFDEPAQLDKVVLNIHSPTLRHLRHKTSS
jgi:hypothetical protein